MNRQARSGGLAQLHLFGLYLTQLLERVRTGNNGYGLACVLVLLAGGARLVMLGSCITSFASLIYVLIIPNGPWPCQGKVGGLQSSEAPLLREGVQRAFGFHESFESEQLCILLDWPQHRGSEFLQRNPQPDLALTLKALLKASDSLNHASPVQVFVGTDVRNASTVERKVGSAGLGHQKIQVRVMPLYGLNGKYIAALNYMARRAYRTTNCSHFLALSSFTTSLHIQTQQEQQVQLGKDASRSVGLDFGGLGRGRNLASLFVAFEEETQNRRGEVLDVIAVSSSEGGYDSWWGLFKRRHMDILSRVLLPASSMKEISALLVSLYISFDATAFEVSFGGTEGTFRKRTRSPPGTDRINSSIAQQVQEIMTRI